MKRQLKTCKTFRNRELQGGYIESRNKENAFVQDTEFRLVEISVLLFSRRENMLTPRITLVTRRNVLVGMNCENHGNTHIFYLSFQKQQSDCFLFSVFCFQRLIKATKVHVHPLSTCGPICFLRSHVAMTLKTSRK